MPVASSDPLFIIDGRATQDSKAFMNLNLTEIKTISIISQSKKLLPLGLMGKNGIVIITTQKGSGIAATTYGSNEVSGLSKPFIRTMRENSSIPVFSTTVFWKPVTITNTSGQASINFSTTNDLGPLLLITEGITGNGQQFYGHKTVYVKSNK
jgi:hypothetical protein